MMVSVRPKGEELRTNLACRVERSGEDSTAREGSEPDRDRGDGEGMVRESRKGRRRVHGRSVEQSAIDVSCELTLKKEATYRPTFQTLTPASSPPLTSAASSCENSRTEMGR